MKKILLILLIVMPFLLTSCSKEETGGFKIVGSEWLLETEQANTFIRFETSTRAVSTMVSKKKAFADVVHAYTYTFDGTNVAFEPEKDGIWAKLNGYISGDNMTVTNLSTKGVTVYKRVK